MLRQTKIDVFLIFFFMMTLIISGQEIFKGHNSFIQKSDPIARITHTALSVKQKSSNQLNWIPASQGEVLEPGDMIFINDKSSATIKFLKGSSVSFSENTLFKIEKETKELILDKGNFRAQITNNQKLTIKVNNKSLVLKGTDADIIVKSNNGNQTLTLIKGKLDVVIPGSEKTISLDNKNLLNLSNNDYIKEAITFQTINPIDNSFIRKQENSEVHFEWIPANKATIIISKDVSFKNIIAEITDVPPLKYELNTGTYYWKVVSATSNTNVSKFSVKNFSSPVIISKYNTVKIQEDESIDLPLAWKHNYASSFDLEIENNNFVQSHKTSNPNYAFNVSSPGVYKWRVKERLKEQEMPFSAWQKIIVKKNLAGPAEHVSPKHNYEANVYKIDKEITPITFTWSSRLGANEYLLEIANDKGFEKIVHSIKTKQTSSNVKIDKKGAYFWRITSSFNDESFVSIPNRINLNINTLKRKLKDGIKVVLKRPGQEVDFYWKKSITSGSSLYELEVSSDPTFQSDVTVKKLSATQYKMKMTKPGTYYWRTKIKSPDNKEIFLAPTKIIFEKSAPPRAPKIRTQKRKFKIRQSMNSRLLNLFIPNAYARVDKYQIEWEKLEDVKHYEIEIYSDKDLKKKVLTQKTNEAKFNWPYGKEGTFYWRVRAIDFWDQEGDFSSVSTFSLEKIKNKRRPLVKIYKPITPKKPSINISLSPRYIQFKQDENISIDGAALTSVNVSGEKNSYLFYTHYIQGVVFEDQNFSDLKLGVYKRDKLWSQPLQYGINVRYLSQYTTKNAIAENDDNLLGYSLSLARLLGENKNYLIEANLGTYMSTTFKYRYILKRFSISLAYEYFSGDETTMNAVELALTYPFEY